MRSVFDTLKETLFVWLRNFWYLAAMALIFLPPDIFLRRLPYCVRALHSVWSPLLGFIASTALLLLDVVYLAAFFGLLKRRQTESVWTAAWCSIKIYTWSLFRLVLLIGLICCIPLFCLAGIKAVIVHFIGSAKLEMLPTSGFFLAFILCALAFPLLVEENLGAIAALKRGWKMTKRNFFYVAGCALIPGLGEWLIRWILALPLDTNDGRISWADALHEVISGTIGSAWGILYWSIYLRIKAIEVQSSSEATSS